MNPITGISPSPAPQTGGTQGQLNMETFLKLLTVQLSSQNPLEPMSDRDFFAQLAQLGQVQGMERLERAQTLGQAAGMVGKNVSAVDAAGQGVTGKVVSVQLHGDTPQAVIQVGEYELVVPFDRILSVEAD